MTGPEAMKHWRAKSDYSQEDVARELDVSLSAVSQWERGVNTPRRANVVSMDEMLEAGGQLLAAFGYASSNADDDHLDPSAALAHLGLEIDTLHKIVADIVSGRGTFTVVDDDGNATTQPGAADARGRVERLEQGLDELRMAVVAAQAQSAEAARLSNELNRQLTESLAELSRRVGDLEDRAG